MKYMAMNPVRTVEPSWMKRRKKRIWTGIQHIVDSAILEYLLLWIWYWEICSLARYYFVTKAAINADARGGCREKIYKRRIVLRIEHRQHCLNGSSRTPNHYGALKEG